MKELAALDAHSLSDGELRDAQIDLARLGAAFTAAQAGIAVVWDQRKGRLRLPQTPPPPTTTNARLNVGA